MNDLFTTLRLRPFVLAVAIPLLAGCQSGENQDTDSQDGTESGTAATSQTDPQNENTVTNAPSSNSVYALSTKTLAGEDVDLAQYQGKVTLFVNVASKCGYTPQYEGLQALHAELGGQDFAVVGVPSNDFGAQEPGTAAEIQEFCSATYGVEFAMLEKQPTKAGESALFDRLAELTGGDRPNWNFCKYLVSKDGTEVKFFKSAVTPSSDELRGAIAELRGQ